MTLSDLSIKVSEPDKNVHLEMFKYLSEGTGANYDFIYFMTDKTFTNGFKLMKEVEALRRSDDIFLGDASKSCPISSGVLFSQKLFSKIVSIMDDTCEITEPGTNWISACIKARTNGNRSCIFIIIICV